MWETAAMIAAAWRKVERAKGRNRCRSRKAKLVLSGWLKAGALVKLPWSGPSTKGIGLLRRKKAKGLGSTAVIGKRRRTTSNSPAKMRCRNCRQAYHSKAREKG